MKVSQHERAPVKIYLHAFFVWIMSVLKTGGYPGIVLLMAMESSIFPIPSELVIPPAAFWASQGHLSYLGVIVAGTFGCWLGSAITYAVSLKLGRPLVTRFLVSEKKLEVGERWVAEFGREGVFFARLLPVVRHLIAIPAGVAGMNFWTFSWTTVLGSAIWCSVLAWFGPQIITPEMFDSPDAMKAAIKAKTKMIVLLIAVVAAAYGLMRYLTRPKKP
jgi:membrane protein DedA with SNARE-associated domain